MKTCPSPRPCRGLRPLLPFLIPLLLARAPLTHEKTVPRRPVVAFLADCRSSAPFPEATHLYSSVSASFEARFPSARIACNESSYLSSLIAYLNDAHIDAIVTDVPDDLCQIVERLACSANKWLLTWACGDYITTRAPNESTNPTFFLRSEPNLLEDSLQQLMSLVRRLKLTHCLAVVLFHAETTLENNWEFLSSVKRFWGRKSPIRFEHNLFSFEEIAQSSFVDSVITAIEENKARCKSI